MVVLAAVAAIAHAQTLFLGNTYTGGDHLSQVLSYRDYLSRALASGRLPEWWDGLNLGVPYASNPANNVFYPPTWIVAVAPMPFAVDLILVLHLVIAGAGGLALARRLGACPIGAAFAGAALIASGYVTSVLVNFLPVLTLAWTPWIAAAADRLAEPPPPPDEHRGRSGRLRSLAERGLALPPLIALQILSGDPAGVVTGALVAVLISLARAPGGRRTRAVIALGCAYAAALPLAAVLLLPAAGLLAESTRSSGLGAERAFLWSMHPARVAEWVWPMALGDPTRAPSHLARVVADSGGEAGMAPSWASSMYIGAPVLLLALLAALRARTGATRILAIGSVAFVVLAFGRYTPIYGAYRTLVPLERLLRFPEKHMAGALIVWVSLAGLGLSRTIEDRAHARWAVRATAAAAVALLVAVGLIHALTPALTAQLSQRAPAFGAPIDFARAFEVIERSGLVEVVVLAGVAAALAGGYRLARGESGSAPRAAAAAAAAICVARLVSSGWQITDLVDRAAVTRPPQLLQPAVSAAAELGQADAPRPRLYRPWARFPLSVPPETLELAKFETAALDIAARFGFATLPGYDPAISRRFTELWRGEDRLSATAFFALYDVRFVIMPLEIAPRLGLEMLGQQLGFALMETSFRRPRAFVAARWAWVATDGEARAAMAADRAEDLGRVLLSGEGQSTPPGERTGEPLSPCAVTIESAESVRLHCSSRLGGYAVLLDSWAPGWRATVDGEEVEIQRADILTRAVPVPAGETEVRFEYETPGLRAGGAVSAVAWLVWVYGWLRLSRARVRGAAAARREHEAEEREPGEGGDGQTGA